MFDNRIVKKRKMTARQKLAQEKRDREHAMQFGIPPVHNYQIDKHPVLAKRNNI